MSHIKNTEMLTKITMVRDLGELTRHYGPLLSTTRQVINQRCARAARVPPARREAQPTNNENNYYKTRIKR